MNSIDVNAQNFEKQVLQSRIPVLVDFWAPWCAPCKMLKPILEKLANEYGGKFLLAKLNTDENPELAQRYQVRGIPDVRLFADGEPVDGFTGVLPESGVRKFLEKAIPSPAEELRRKAATLPPVEAKTLLVEALRLDPKNVPARLDLAEIVVAEDEIQPAKALLEGMEESDRLLKLRKRIEFIEKGAAAPGEHELLEMIEKNPLDPEPRMQLAGLHASKQQYEAALEQLLEVVRVDRTRQEARRTMLSIFEIAPPELVSRYRKLLASALN